LCFSLCAFRSLAVIFEKTVFESALPISLIWLPVNHSFFLWYDKWHRR
jgi:hypothetical protein